MSEGSYSVVATNAGGAKTASFLLHVQSLAENRPPPDDQNDPVQLRSSLKSNIVFLGLDHGIHNKHEIANDIKTAVEPSTTTSDMGTDRIVTTTKNELVRMSRVDVLESEEQTSYVASQNAGAVVSGVVILVIFVVLLLGILVYNFSRRKEYQRIPI